MRKSTKRNIFLASLVAAGYAAFRIGAKWKKLNSMYNNCLVFSAKDIELNENEEFSGDSIGAIFSSVDIDLRKATLKGDIATLDLYGAFSSIDIKVPEGWNIKVEGIDEKSEVDNEIEFDEDKEELPLLHIKYNVKYSALDISH
ncbi:hypothetical protein [Vallitalea okinawensis]|uniref:hypothetical protein n=1 Tax=Vallitalea okinawensis TaxID=2078660 RepID=UPI000CFD7D32|nr:hypothetical protein [Vallitalea okinawensis]